MGSRGGEGRWLGLDVRPDPHLFGRADQHRHLAVSAGGEQVGLGLVGAGLMDEPDGVAGHAAVGQQGPQLVVCVPAAPRRGGGVAEDQLEGARPLVWLPALV